uniref:Uncharacterized protein n=1 Tax=Anguilla anguilla TaxID=7936 RepID=A0A0E9SPJ9_ANGAN
MRHWQSMSLLSFSKFVHLLPVFAILKCDRDVSGHGTLFCVGDGWEWL